MKITKIKQIEWWDPKSRTDAVTWKVWVNHNNLTHLVYFTNKEELDKFVALEDKPRKTTSKNKASK